MLLGIVQDIESIGDILERNSDRLVLVSRDRDLEMIDAIFLHEEDIFSRIFLGDEREDGFQAEGAQVLEVAIHGEAAPVDAWSDFSKVEDSA